MNENDRTAIETIRTQTISILQELANAPKPSYTVDNYKLTWNEYQSRLTRTVDWCDKKLAAESPYEFRCEAET